MFEARDFRIKKMDLNLQVKDISTGAKVAISTVSRLMNDKMNPTVTLSLARKVWDFLILKETERSEIQD